MAKMLTPEEWRVQKPPMAFTRITYSSWTGTHFDFCEKWIVEHCEGWVWHNREDKVYVFGLKSDATLFDLWLEEGVMDRDRGDLSSKEV